MGRSFSSRFFSFVFSSTLSTLFAITVFSNRSYGNEPDSDLDGIPDYWEIIYGLDPDYAGDARESKDMDLLSNLAEYRLGTNPEREDTDRDGVGDGGDPWPSDARYAYDANGDAMPDSWEQARGLSAGDSGDALADPDGDQLTNLQEFLLGTRIDLMDSDGDGVADNLDPWPLNPDFSNDSDGDGLPDRYEQRYSFLHESTAGDAQEDIDGDLLTALQEFALGADPQNPDSDSDGVLDSEDVAPTDPQYRFDRDGDGVPDEWEARYGFSSANPYDAVNPYEGDNDGLSPLREFLAGTDPRLDDTDFDGIPDGRDRFPLYPAEAGVADGDSALDAWESTKDLSEGNTLAEPHNHRDGPRSLGEYRASTRVDFENGDPGAAWDGGKVASLSPGYRHSYEEGAYKSWYEFPDSGYPVARHRDALPDSEGRAADPEDVRDGDGDGMPVEWESQHYLYDTLFDDDDDGLSNRQENRLGTDPNNRDSDGDGVEDGEDRYPLDPQYRFDRDHDGIPENWEMRYGFSDKDGGDGGDDPDGDKARNRLEFAQGTDPNNPDTDNDGEIDGYDWWPLDPTKARDDDFDGLPNAWEESHGLTSYNLADASMDFDGDGLSNLQEYLAGTRMDLADSDGDGVEDGVDPWPLQADYRRDLDGDGLPAAFERAYRFLSDENGRDAAGDFDGDGLSNLSEFKAGTDPETRDSDGDGINDGEDVAPADSRYRLDADRDGLPNEWEFAYGLDQFDSRDANDPYAGDSDGLTPLQEFQSGTDPASPDTDEDFVYDDKDCYPLNPLYHRDGDRDSMPDYWEIEHGFNPDGALDGSRDPDGDGISNRHEFARGSDPLVDEQRAYDNVRVPDYWKALYGY